MSKENPTITIDEVVHDVTSLTKEQQFVVIAINKCDRVRFTISGNV